MSEGVLNRNFASYGNDNSILANKQLGLTMNLVKNRLNFLNLEI